MSSLQRTITITNAAYVLRSDQPAFKGPVAAAVDSTHFDLPSTASAIDDFLAGLHGSFLKGVGDLGKPFLCVDYTGVSKRVTVASAITQPTTATLVEFEPNLPRAWTEIAFGSATADLSYAFMIGGTTNVATRITLTAGDVRTIDRWTMGHIDAIEFLSTIASDTLRIEFTG